MKTSWNGRRHHRSSCGSPKSMLFTAIFTFAGNTAIRRAINPYEAMRLRRGMRRPTPPAISHTPLRFMRNCGNGKNSGIISWYIYGFWKCIQPAKTKKIAANNVARFFNAAENFRSRDFSVFSMRDNDNCFHRTSHISHKLYSELSGPRFVVRVL